MKGFFTTIKKELKLASGETFHVNNIAEINSLIAYPETFHQLIKVYLIIGQFFAVMPLYGVASKHANDLKYKIFGIHIIYSLIILIATISSACMNLYWISIQSVKFSHMSPFIWFFVNALIMYEFIRIARKWPHLMQLWEKVELKPTTVQNKKCHNKFKNLIKIISLGIPLISLVEHLLSIANGFVTAKNCNTNKTILEAYFYQGFPAYYTFFSYNLQSGVLLEILNLYCTFTWNFADGFLIIISLGLTAQFQHFNKNFDQHKGKALPDAFWGKYRLYYNILICLLTAVNKHISVIILISISNNLYYICVQLFHSFTTTKSLIRSIYFWFSLSFLIGRTFLVSLSAAKIHEESKKPILILHTIPTIVYKTEAKRFLEQVSNHITALSGLNFFYITRKFMLSVAGTVITYELVLIQLQREPATDIDSCPH